MLSRAIVIDKLGPPGVLEERSLELPDPGPGEVHLKVLAAGVNFADLMMRIGLYGTVPPRPYSPGFEVAGQVQACGEGVTGLVIGDRVVAMKRFGGYAHDVIVPVNQIFPWPGSLSPAEAAAIPVVFLTAWICLFRSGAARAGERVLVLGAGGGVGTAAVQLGVRAGLTVYGTAGTEPKRTYIKEKLGAVACYDSRGQWESSLRADLQGSSLDLALDPVGGEATKSCRRLLGPLSRLVVYGLSEAAPGVRKNWLRVMWAWLRTPRFHPIDLIQPNLSISGVHLLHLGAKENVLRECYQEMLPGFASGELFPVLDKTFPLTATGAAAAHQYLHERKNLGKVVLVREDD